MKRIGNFVCVFVCFVCVTGAFSEETWTGEAGDNEWSSNLNWGEVLDGADPGEDLHFPLSADRKTNHNDFAVNTSFNSLRFTGNGYLITGEQIVLVDGIEATVPAGSPPQFSPNILMGGSQSFQSHGATNYELNGVVNLNGHTLTFSGSGRHRLDGLINGTGSIMVNLTNAITASKGTAVLNGTSVSFGTTTINHGTLEVNGAIGAVTLSGGTLAGQGTVSNVIADADGGAISPGIGDNDAGFFDVVGLVNIARTNASLNVDLNGATVGSQYDRLVVTGGNAVLSNATLLVSLGFTPTNGQKFDILQQSGSGNVQGQFAQGSAVYGDGRLFSITYGASNVVLTVLDSTLTWTGASASNTWSNVTNWNPAVAPADGLDLVFPDIAGNKTNINNIASGTNFDWITISGNGYAISGNGISLSGGISNNVPVGTSPVFSPHISLKSNLTFSSSSVTPYRLNGDLIMNGRFLDLTGAGNHLLNGNILVGGSLGKNGTGTAVINSANATGVFTGVGAGELQINRNLGDVSLGGGTLSGTGVVKNITNLNLPGSTVSPGTGGTNTGFLTANGDVTLGSVITFRVDLNGSTQGAQYDCLKVLNANVILSNVNLSVSRGFTPTNGQTFEIVQRSGAGGIAGTFAQGTSVISDGKSFLITYSSSNIVLTAGSLPQLTGFNLLPGALVLSGFQGDPASTYFVLASTNILLPLTNWQVVATNVFDGTGNFILTNGINPSLPQQFLIIK